jgi:hypothetical protein
MFECLAGLVLKFESQQGPIDVVEKGVSITMPLADGYY